MTGVWLHVVLRDLAPGGETFPEFGVGHENRIRNLQRLVERAKTYGISVYLYMNEPRAEKAEFFEKSGRETMRGTQEGDFYALCTSNPSVCAWLGDSLAYVFQQVPDLGGIFTITASENFTNCASHGHKDSCSACAGREYADIIADVNRVMEEGVHRSAPDAKVIVWDWGWNGHGITPEIIQKLPPNVYLMSVSEWALPITRGGVSSAVGEYSISAVGPGPRAAAQWKSAQEAGLKTAAKIQLGTTWEFAAVPYVPVMNLVAEHCRNLASCGVSGLMGSWSLGGYPSPNLTLPAAFSRTPLPSVDEVLNQLAAERYDPSVVPAVREAWKTLSDAYKEFPYHISVNYTGPQQMGPANPLYPSPTGFSATMVGIPYDSLDAWRGCYPPEVFISQMRKTSEGMLRGAEMLEKTLANVPEQRRAACAQDVRYARCAGIHFASAANQAEWVLLRGNNALNDDFRTNFEPKTLDRFRELLRDEIALAQQELTLVREDSTIGFESTNHYWFTPQDLVEKIAQCRLLLEKLAPRVCRVFPTPRIVEDSGLTLKIVPKTLEVSYASDAPEPVRYAAEMLKKTLQNRFPEPSEGVKAAETTVKNGARIVLEVGPIECKECAGKTNVFQIRFENDAENTIRVTGSDVNGVVYGTYALLDLCSRSPKEETIGTDRTIGTDGTVEAAGFNITDWPSIPWRGRPHFVLMQNLVPGALDAYAHARINYMDVRDNPKISTTNIYPDRAAPMGFAPGVPIDRENVSRLLTEAHRRGMFVYACVAAATTKNAGGIIVGFDQLDETNFYSDVNAAFEELLALGADGLWLSFDDIGAGNDSKLAIANFLHLAEKHGLSGRELAFTPPVGDYQTIDRPFNHEAAKIPGFDAIQWYFTRVPCAADAELCSKMGLKLKPAWWHNLISLHSGFMNNAQIAVSLRPGFVQSETFRHAASSFGETPIPLPAYIELHPLSAGWHAPQYDAVRTVPQFTDNVMLFCIGGGFPEEYLASMFGFWAWNPENFDWNLCQTAIYSWVFGPEQAASAREFDAKLVELKSYFILPSRFFTPGKDFPPRLKSPTEETRTKVFALLNELDALCATLNEAAPHTSALNRDRLEIVYLEPMRKTLEIARFCAEADFPEYHPEGSLTAEELNALADPIYARLAPELKGMDAWRSAVQKFQK